LDLARKMILLSGLRLDEDVQIQFSGLRAGEKLFEELHSSEEEPGKTPHAKIRVLRGPYTFPNGSRPAAEILRRQLEALRSEVTSRDFGATLTLLKEMVPEYTPSDVVLSRALQESSSTKVASV
jgi:FlaA1/EpsC-like NDP-sugar epimerase